MTKTLSPTKDTKMKFVIDWDVPRPNTLATLVAARHDFQKCQIKLINQKDDTETMRKEINGSWKELGEKQTSLTKLHLEFEKLESEDMKKRASGKLDEEKILQQKLYVQLKEVKEEVEKLKIVKDKIESKLKHFTKFETYLKYVVEHDKEFTTVDNLLDRYRTLCNMQKKLADNLETDLQFMIQSRNDSDDLTEEKCNMINILRNRLAKVQVKAKATSENVLYWETLVTSIKTFIAEKTLELETVQAATWSLYKQMCFRHKVENQVGKRNFEKQIHFIYKIIHQYKQILEIALEKSQETCQSQRPNSSVVSVKNPK